MKFMNDWDLMQARARFTRSGQVPNRLALVTVVDRLREETNMVSDGWAYWSKPCAAAKRAIEHIESTAYPEYERREREDITEAEMLAAVRPIKAFLTRHRTIYSADQRERILRSVMA